jgi:hypothetical protein
MTCWMLFVKQILAILLNSPAQPHDPHSFLFFHSHCFFTLASLSITISHIYKAGIITLVLRLLYLVQILRQRHSTSAISCQAHSFAGVKTTTIALSTLLAPNDSLLGVLTELRNLDRCTVSSSHRWCHWPPKNPTHQVSRTPGPLRGPLEACGTYFDVALFKDLPTHLIFRCRDCQSW